jgi:predicted nucleic acid-binding protein
MDTSTEEDPAGGRPVAVYDANVLYPAQLRDFLMRLALQEAVRAHWTDQIHEEWMRNVEADYPDISWEDLRHVRELMEKALPGASIDRYEDLVSTISLPDPSDRHVLAAAIRAEASHIITFNVADFPDETLAPHGIEATSPDDFISELTNRFPEKVLRTAKTHRASLSHPPKSPGEYLSLFKESGLEETARWLSGRKNKI